jgi:hypothetical protein
MREETFKFLFESSGINLEDEIEIFVTNYHQIIYMWRVIQVQIIEDQERREEAHKAVMGLRDEEEEKNAELLLIRHNLRAEKNQPMMNRDEDQIRSMENEIKSLEKQLGKIKSQIKKQISIRDESRPVKYYLNNLDPSDLLVRVVLKHWKTIQKIERLDYKVRRFFGGSAFKISDKFANYVKNVSIKTGSLTVSDFATFCERIPENLKHKLEASVDMDKHVHSEED